MCLMYFGCEMLERCSVLFLVNGVVSFVRVCVLLCMFIC